MKTKIKASRKKILNLKYHIVWEVLSKHGRSCVATLLILVKFLSLRQKTFNYAIISKEEILPTYQRHFVNNCFQHLPTVFYYLLC